ncbi:MAG: VOC family protein [Dehalococcoidia bacterium]
MFGLKRVDHISMAVWSIDDQLPFFTELLGLTLAGRFRNEREGYLGAVLDFPGKQLQMELLEPIGEDGFVARFLRERGPGFHHVTIQAEDVEQAAAAMRGFGVEPFQGVTGGPDFRHTYIHPKESGGILWQVFSSDGKPGWKPAK